MKVKSIIVVLSVVLLTSLFIGNFALAKNDYRYNPFRNNPFTQIWYTIFNIQNDVRGLQVKASNLQSQEQQTQTTIENLQTQIVDLQNQIEELKTDGTTRIVYEGTFDVFVDGDFVVHSIATPISAAHYKRVDAPELTLNDMPIVKVYTKPYNVTRGVTNPPEDVELLNNVWYEQDYGPFSVSDRANAILYGEGAVYIFYRNDFHGNTNQIVINGDYKIVIIK